MRERDEKQEYIKIRGARVHNLKNIDLDISRGKLVVITGLSGSGKSTLAFDTIYAEGHRRYVESLSSYVRQFMGKIEKPDVDSIEGIAPAIAIEQRVTSRNSRSTVGTSTEIYDYLRLLFARIGHTFSPISGVEVISHSIVDVQNALQKIESRKRVLLTIQLKVVESSSAVEALLEVIKNGLSRLYVDGELYDINDFLQREDDINSKEIYVVVDRFIGGEIENSRALDSATRAFSLGDGELQIFSNSDSKGWICERFSSRFEADGVQFDHPTEHLFSYNNPLGACPNCQGAGFVNGIDEELVVPDKSKSIFQDAIVCWRGETMSEWKRELIAAATESKIDIHKPYYELSREQKLLIWTGNEHFSGLNEFFLFLKSQHYKIQYRVMLSRYSGKSVCPECGGSRLRKEANYVKIGGKSITELSIMPVGELLEFFKTLKLDDYDSTIGERVLQEINSRVKYLCEVGLDYLTLDRISSTLSGGEAQRILLSTSLGSSLVGSLYILDEPSIGLHPRDNRRLIEVLKQLRDVGNSVIVVEHEREVIDAADELIDMGPLAGELGGEVVYAGRADKLTKKIAKKSLTAAYLLGEKEIAVPKAVREWRDYIEIKGARQNNLKMLDVKFPLGIMCCVTGVSGSGKSSLVGDILYPALRRELMEVGGRIGNYDSLTGDIHRIKGVEYVDQNPIGKGSRSNPVTYIKAYDEIRRLFSEQPLAVAQRFDHSSFSFNIAGGRCDECKGEGVIKIEMQFMADVVLVCEKCGGKRFKDNILTVKYRGKSISDILDMTIDSAIEFFGQDRSNKYNSKIIAKLKVLSDVGLGYIRLGQSSSTLSGGESQRVKLASFLLKDKSEGNLFFIFDEPTTGLHFEDIRKLLLALNALVDAGHTVLIVEHNMDVIKCADWVIDIGPEAGDKGGNVVFEGTPKQLVNSAVGYTSQFLKQEIKEK